MSLDERKSLMGSLLPPSEEKEAFLKRARLADTASRLDVQANSSGLRPPK
jgi:hypothetical protein